MDIRIVRFVSFLTALKTLYSNANKYAKKTGERLLSMERIRERLESCQTCDNFTGKSCKLCGCCGGDQRSYFNKLAYPTETCPATPPKWGTVEDE